MIGRSLGAIMLVAGTSIGGGMIALPMSLASVGLIPGLAIMVGVWAVAYYSALINLELNVRAGKGLALGAMGRYFSGPSMELLGNFSLWVLTFSLLAVYLLGGSSIVKETMLEMDTPFSPDFLIRAGALILLGILCLPLRLVDYVNRVLFVALIGAILVLTVGLAARALMLNDLPWFESGISSWRALGAVVLVVFTSFGFQVIFHTIAAYCDFKASVLKRVFFWGSLIPALVYILWVFGVLGMIHHTRPTFYREMVMGSDNAGRLVKELSAISQWKGMHYLVGWVSFLAIVTSAIGVGIGLLQSLKQAGEGLLGKNWAPASVRKISAAVLAVGIPYVWIFYISRTFLKVLGFAGIILALVALLIPGYLLYRSDARMKGSRKGKAGYTYWEAGNPVLFWGAIAISIGIIMLDVAKNFGL